MFQAGDILVRRDGQEGYHTVVAVVERARKSQQLVAVRDDGNVVTRHANGKVSGIDGRDSFNDLMKPKSKRSVTWYQNIYRSGSVSSFHDKASAERFASHRDAVAVAKPYTFEWEE